MTELSETLKSLVAQACIYPPGSPERQRCVQQLHYQVTRSNKLWREAVPYYSDALQDMWVYCCQNLEEYDSSIAGVITWLDSHLKRILRRYRDRQQRDQKRHLSTLISDDGRPLDPVERIPARPDVSPLLEMWEKTLEWVHSDPDGNLKSTCFRKRADINAQVLFLMRFPTQTPWKDIAQRFELNAAESTDLPKFYNRRCLPLLRAFGADQGFLTE
ncbi:MAG: hypothetical protein WBA57_15505 [Elainellaceae cyanobacterium]